MASLKSELQSLKFKSLKIPTELTRFLSPSDGLLQSASDHHVRKRVPDDSIRQNSEVQNAGDELREAGHPVELENRVSFSG